jgi:hypothetical protein
MRIQRSDDLNADARGCMGGKGADGADRQVQRGLPHWEPSHWGPGMSFLSDTGFAGHIHQSEVLAGLSYALDLTEGQRPGHSVRSCLIGMRIAEAMKLSADDGSGLFYALLMKDLGCSSNAARFAALFGNNDHDIKADLKTIDRNCACSAAPRCCTTSANSASRIRFWTNLAS